MQEYLKWTDPEDDLLVEYYNKNFKLNAIAKKISRPLRGVKKRLSILRKKGLIGKAYHKSGSAIKELDNTDFGNSAIAENLEFPVYNQALQINEHTATVIADCHLPFIDWRLWERCCKVSKKIGSRTLIIAGDIFNQDAFSFFISADGPGSWRKERDTGSLFFKQALQYFKQIYLIAGNHDMRFFKIVMGQIDYPDWLKMVSDEIGKRIIVSGNYRYCDMGGKWRITHPKNYSKISTRVSEQIAIKTQKNVLSGHGHHQGIRYDPSAKLLCVDTGCMLEPEKCEYTSVIDTTHPYWNPGFVIIENDYPTLFSNKLTDWKKWGL